MSLKTATGLWRAGLTLKDCCEGSTGAICRILALFNGPGFRFEQDWSYMNYS